MSLDLTLRTARKVRFEANITHNLNTMADAAGLYYPIWRPCEFLANRDGIVPLTPQAREIIPALTAGLETLRADPTKFKAFNPENGWGDYEGLVDFTQKYLTACKQWPNACIVAER